MRIMPFMKRKKGVQFAGVGLDIGEGGTTDYTDLSNKPQINGVTLAGNKTLADLEVQGALTFDTTPTENSSNPVTSGGIWSASNTKLDSYQLINVIENETVSVQLKGQTTYLLCTTSNVGKLARLIQTFNTGVWQDAVDFVTPSGAFNITYSDLTLRIESTGYAGRFSLLKISKGF